MTVTRCRRCHPVPKNQQVLANFVGRQLDRKQKQLDRVGNGTGEGIVKRKLCKINYNWKQMNAKTISSQRIPQQRPQKAPAATLPIKIKERPQGEREREGDGGVRAVLIKNWGRWNKCSHLQSKKHKIGWSLQLDKSSVFWGEGGGGKGTWTLAELNRKLTRGCNEPTYWRGYFMAQRRDWLSL